MSILAPQKVKFSVSDNEFNKFKEYLSTDNLIQYLNSIYTEQQNLKISNLISPFLVHAIIQNDIDCVKQILKNSSLQTKDLLTTLNNPLLPPYLMIILGLRLSPALNQRLMFLPPALVG